jgi:Ca2+-binding EF-hand superfamily protein
VYNVFTKKSKWIAAAAVATLMAPMGVAMAAPSVDDVIAKYVKASGGEAKIKAVTSVVKKGKMLIPDMGMEANLGATRSGENFLNRIEIEGMGEITQGITNGTVWQVHVMEGDSVLEGEKAEAVMQQADDFAWMSWNKYFAGAEVAGEEDGAVKIVFAAKGDGEDTNAYFDSKTGLLSKLESTGPDGSAATLSFTEYKEVGGVTLSHKTEIAGAMNLEMIFETIEVNVDVDPSVFEVPEAIQAMMPAEGETAASLMAQMDANGDGKVTLDEAPEEMKQYFPMIDANADESVDLEEMQTVADFVNGQ